MTRYGMGATKTPKAHYFVDLHALEQCHAQALAKRTVKSGCGKFLALPGMRDCLFDGIEPENEQMYNKCLSTGDKQSCDEFAKIAKRECGEYFPQSPVLPPETDTPEEADKWREEFERGDIWHCYVGGSCARMLPAEVTPMPENSEFLVVLGIFALTAFLLRDK